MRGNFLFAWIVLPTALAVLGFVAQRGDTVRGAMSGPIYTRNGDLLPPASYREWIFLSSGVDMSYNKKSAKLTMFDNVFVNAEAYRSFLVTGTWPDKTVLVLENREGKDKGSINEKGHYQGTDVMGLEVHIKDEMRFPGKWAFFGFESETRPGKLIPKAADCYGCHEAHGAVDTTFVQFYPTLIPIARAKQTLTAEFLKIDASMREK